ncbi:MAG: ABC transporter substrate-binding protein [Nitratireductor sp.]|nr:ABC transporter substrate-binding protein [Nitratireductor sp.]
MKRAILSHLIAMALACTAAVSPTKAEDGITDSEILIGEVLMLSGPASFIGKSAAAGSKLAIAEINANGGINGRKLRGIYEDDGYVPARSVAAARRLVDVEKVFAVTGTTGGSGVTAIMPVLEEAGVPTIVHVAPNPSVLNPRKPNVFMIGPDYDLAALVGIRYLVNEKELKNAKFGLIYQEDDYGKSVLSGYKQAMEELGLTSVAELPYKRGAKDFSAEALRFKEAGVEVLYLGTVISEAVGIMSEIRRLGMEPTVIGNWAAGLPITIKLSAESGYDFYFTDYYASASDAAGEKLYALAGSLLSEEDAAAMGRYGVGGYVAIKVLASAIEQCGQEPTRACVIEKLGAVKDFDTGGLTGPISLDNEDGHAIPPIKVFQVDRAGGSVKTLTDFLQY